MNKSVLFLLSTVLTLSTLSIANGKILDITHKITADLPAWDSKDGTGDDYIWLVSSIKKGNASNNSEFKLSTHMGTHIDAPSHFFQRYYDLGFDVTSLDLNVLNGPALLVDVPRDTNLTAEALKSLNIPHGVHRVLFRTLNTDRRLMHKKEFHSDFVGFMADGAKWLVENTEIKLVGLDYLSISAYVNAIPVHRTFLKSRQIHVVEGLNLDDIQAGPYDLHCLPLRLSRADGCPARCILYEIERDLLE